MKRIATLMVLVFLLNCNREEEQAPLFTLMDSALTGVEFQNDLEYTPEFNMYTYRNFYNGGGVGIGDINNDGLPDLFFCGNLVDNKLYLNRGNFQFEDITEKAGVASENVWTTGVSFADVNADGWLDIYVCKSGRPGGDRRYNELFINNGDLTFTERAKAYGIADEGFSSHAAFLDYDRDGDIDMYLLNNSFRNVGGYDMRPGLRDIRDELGGNKLYRNELISTTESEAAFTDVSAEAGIYGSQIGFGLGVTVGDVNRDGWQDIFVSNDFFERDYLYINQQDGSFLEDLVNQMPEISMGSMGADMADINNDGYPEIFVTEMLPRDEARYKTKMTFENWDKYQLAVRSGYHHQFTRNVLQLNNGNSTFSEIGRLGGVHATDWSWSALIADFDNDGHKDLYVSNGITKDLLDQDYINFHSNDPAIVQSIKNRDPQGILKLIDIIPSERIPNYAFRNNGDLTFSEVAAPWGLAVPSHSNGSAYGDLDNDGDLDLVVNNVNMPAFLFRNDLQQQSPQNYLQFILKGRGANKFALGAQVTIRHGTQVFFREQAPMRGFQSCIDYKLHFGLGHIEKVDEVRIFWPDGRETVYKDLVAGQQLTIEQEESAVMASPRARNEKVGWLSEIPLPEGLEYRHVENDFVDFDRDRLLLHMISAEGPPLSKADVNADGLEDVFVGGAAGQSATLYLQSSEGRFTADTKTFQNDRAPEDTDAIFFDADGDGDQDLYVTSGGNEFRPPSTHLTDRLYLNDGSGHFQKSPRALSTLKAESTSCVRNADFDGDGDQDLFLGVRLLPGVYGVPVNGYLLVNNGAGQFEDKTAELAPGLQELGMITDAVWTDHDLDGSPDLMIVGEWMPVTLFRNEKGLLKKAPGKGLASSHGFWNCIESADLDGDGDPDFIVGNLGLNSRLKASPNRPITMLVNDFDKNRTAEQIISQYNGPRSYPLVLRHDLVMQLPELKKKYLYYEDYKEKTVTDILTDKQIRTSSQSQVFSTQTALAWNNGDGSFTMEALPPLAQLAPVYAILVDDFNRDNRPDILLGGNFSRSKPEIGIYAASYGLVLEGLENRAFKALSALESGLSIRGEVREFIRLEVAGKELILVGRNNDSMMALDRD